MPELTSIQAPEILAACQTGKADAADRLGRALEGQFQLEPGECQACDVTAAEYAGPGLAVLLTLGTTAAVVLLPESSGMLPGWYAAPDAAGTNRLHTLAQELGTILLPESLCPSAFAAARVPDLRAALEAGGISADAVCIRLALARDGQSATFSLVWPLENPPGVFAPPGDSNAQRSGGAAGAPAEQISGPAPAPAIEPGATFAALPPYGRSLLKIRVPVTVTLATARESVSRIIELMPGTILQFAKSCDEPLRLEVGGSAVAVGEAVKVNERFGLRVTSIVMPDERFVSVGRRASG